MIPASPPPALVPPVHPRDRGAAEDASELLPDGLVTIDHERVIIHVNRIAQRILRRRQEELLGRLVEEVMPLRDHDGNDWWQIASPWEGLAIRTGHRERLLVLEDGRDVLVTARYLRTRHLGPVGAVLIGLRDAEARIRAERDHAALITTVAHELRSPLTGVKGFAETLLTNWTRFSDEQRRFMVEAMAVDAARLSRLITDLLDLSRLDARRLAVHPVDIEVHGALARHQNRRSEWAPSTREVHVDCPAGLVVRADPDRLDQIVGNLLDNALRHGEGRVTLWARPADDQVEIAVLDEGRGVQPGHRALAFVRFWQSTDRADSTGLGLYLVHGYAQAHGGSAAIVEDEDGRSHVRVRLPRGGHPTA